MGVVACLVMVGREAKEEEETTTVVLVRCSVEILEQQQKKAGDTMAAREEKDPKEAMVSMKKLIRCSVEMLEQQQKKAGGIMVWVFMVGREEKEPSDPTMVFIQKFKASLRCSVVVITLEMLMKK